MRRSSLSRTSTRMEGLCRAMTAAVGPPILVGQPITEAEKSDIENVKNNVKNRDSNATFKPKINILRCKIH